MNRILLALLLVGALGLVYLLLDRGEGKSPSPSASRPAEDVRSELTRSDEDLVLPPVFHESVEQRESIQAEASVNGHLAYAVRVVVEGESFFPGPLAGVQVQLGVALGEELAGGPPRAGKFLLAEATVDAGGLAFVELPVPKELMMRAALKKGARLFVWGSVNDSGHCRRVALKPLPVDSEKQVTLRLRHELGRTIYGQLLLEDGTPAPSGTACLCRVDSEFKPTATLSHESVNADGRFTMHMKRTGRLAIHAEVMGVGAVTSGLLEFSDEEPLELELTVLGSAVVAGRVVGEDGHAFPNYSMCVSPFKVPENQEVVPFHLKRVLAQWGGGLKSYLTSTDENGLFRFGGLQSGTYKIRGLDPASGGYTVPLTREAVQTDRLDLQLVVSGYRLLVHVLDWEGKSLKDLGLAHDSTGVLSRKYNLYCEPCDATGALLSSRTSITRGRSQLASGAVVLDVKAGLSYIVGVVSQGNQLEELVVHIPQGEPRSERTLQLRSPPTPTRLTVKVLDPAGVVFTGDAQLRVFAPNSGRLLVESSHKNTNGEIKVPLGPGSYRVQVSAESWGWHHSMRDEVAPYAMAEEFVELRAGSEQMFELQLKLRGKLELSVELESEFPLPMIDLPDVVTRGNAEALRFFYRGVLVRVEPLKSARTVRLEFEVHKEGTPVSISPWFREPWLPIGQSAKAITAIPIGEYDLIISPPGFRELRRRVTFEEGKTTKIEIKLTQQDLLD